MQQKKTTKNILEYMHITTDYLFIKDINGKYIQCNESYLQFLNKTEEEVIGKSDYDFLSKENADQCFKDDQDTLNGDHPLDFEEIFTFDDKDTVYFRVTKQVLYDENKNFKGLLTIARDQTQTKQYQLIYEDNNELLEYMNYETDTKKILEKIIHLSEKRNKNLKCSILLYDEKNDQLRKGAAPSLPEFYIQAIENLSIEKDIGSYETAVFYNKRVITQNINSDPGWKPFLHLTQRANLHACWSEPIFSSENKILGSFTMYNNKPSNPSEFQLKLISSYAHLVAVTLEKENKKIEADIKVRKSLEKKLHKKANALELYKQVIDHVNYGVSITTPEKPHKLIYVNKAFEKITGYTKNEVLGQTCRFLQKKDTKQKGIIQLQNAIENRQKIRVELRNYKKDGTLFYNFLSLAPVYDEQKSLTHFVGIQQDITTEKQQEARITEQSKLASMGEMIANIAHQWRQPLSVISTASTGMQLQKEFGLLKDEEFNKTCTAINENVQYLSQTIDDFKNFIKNDSPKKYFNLTNNINKFLSLVSGTLKNSQIEAIVKSDDSIQIDGYENELIQCFMNIFNNAKDAYDDKQKKLLFIDAYEKNKKVVIRIKDNAGGIPEDIIGKIFEPYFTTKHKFQGTGLGLHMTYNLIDEGMRGRIRVINTNYSYKDKNYTGAEFMIILPFM